MTSPHTDRFTRVPVEWLDALLKMSLTGTELRVVLWVVRQTLGWNRETASFTWYRMAKELGADRGGVFRAGKRLIREQVLVSGNGQIAVTTNPRVRPGIRRDPGTMTVSSGCDSTRGSPSSVFRGAIDKETSQRDKEIRLQPSGDARHRFGADPHPAGAARPIRGKYDSVSKD